MRPLRAKSILGRRYGYRPSPATHPVALRAFRPPLKIGATPEAVDLSAWFPGIRDQGQEGACTGFATAAFREVLHGSSAQQKLDHRLSPAYLYARTRMAEGSFPSDSGACMCDEFAVLQAYGVCPEEDLPYDADPSEAPTPICDAAAVPMRIGQPMTVDRSSSEAIKTVLAAGMPIGIGIPVFQSFESPGAGGMLTMPDPLKEALLGGHGLCVMGYDATGWLVANQWGTSWGGSGWCWMPFGYERFWWEAWTASMAA